MRVAPKASRRRQILEALAAELERGAGTRITTARLAAVVGVSEAALYRHFPSKAKMFEALIEFAEESVFGLTSRILAETREAPDRCARTLALLLGFAERNPGITRVLLGDALVGENPRLRKRTAQFFDRVEAQLRQILRADPHYRDGPRAEALASDANLMLAVVEGRLSQFCRGDFRQRPTAGWERQWRTLATALFGT